MRDYELMTIHHPDLGEDEVSTKIDDIESLLDREGASVAKKDLWGRRRFAYEIDHVTEGHYSVVTFQSEPGPVAAVDRVLGLADEVIRHKIVRAETAPPSPRTSTEPPPPPTRGSRQTPGNRHPGPA